MRTYLPEFTVADPEASRLITVRHLLNQTSGLADAGVADATLPPARSARQRVANLRAARPVSPPGAEFHYTDPNYGVLARLVEVVSGQPFDGYPAPGASRAELLAAIGQQRPVLPELSSS